MYQAAIRATSQLLESRINPTKKPSKVAQTIDRIETTSVLTMPTLKTVR